MYKDFRKMPPRLNWFIENGRKWNDMGDDGIYEVPIGTFHNNIFKKVLSPKSISFIKDKRMGNYMPIQTSCDHSRFPRINSYLRYAKDYSLLSLDSINANYLWYQLEKIESRKECTNIAIISHPKLSGPHYFANMDLFLSGYNNDRKTRFNFVSMRDIYNQLKDNSRWKQILK